MIMWGWRARIGFIIPSSDLVEESDYSDMAPEGVSVHFTRKLLRQPYARNLMEYSQDLEKDVKLLTPVKPNVIVLGGTSATFLGGPGFDEKVASALGKAAGIRATTTSTSVLSAMRALQLKRISVLSPYPHEVNQRLVTFFEGNGFKIQKLKELELDTDLKISQVHPEAIYRHGREVDVPDTDGLFISCTTLRAADAIEYLERDLEKPVVTSNQATMWNALRIAGIKDRINGYGQLLNRL